MKISSSFSLFRASCRIRTNDPEITNHVLWPTELKRHVSICTFPKKDTKMGCKCRDLFFLLQQIFVFFANNQE